MGDFESPSFVKWAGGKRRLIGKLEPLFPIEIDRYFEPFLGGGAVFFYIKQKYNPKTCVISDINEDLIATYIAVRDRLPLLIRYLAFFKRKNSKNFYYTTRKKFNQKRIRGIKRCAAFIYLNKTCFNGLHRVNTKNEFNVPYAYYSRPEIYSTPALEIASRLLQGVDIRTLDYEEILTEIRSGDFVYLDPCYDPLTKDSFDKYTPKRFSSAERHRLFQFIKKLRERRASILLSNSDSKGLRALYKEYDIAEILAPRVINSNGQQRGQIIELAITNY